MTRLRERDERERGANSVNKPNQDLWHNQIECVGNSKNEVWYKGEVLDDQVERETLNATINYNYNLYHNIILRFFITLPS